MRTGQEYFGSVRLQTPDRMVTGSMGTIQIVYRAGRYGIDDRGNFRLAWRSISDMQMPQFDRPEAAGYTTVSATGDVKFRLSTPRHVRPYQNCLNIQIVDGFLRDGEELVITLGDRTYGSPGIRMQSFYERESEFLPLLDACGTGRFELLEERIKIEMLPGPYAMLHVVAPSNVEPNAPFSIALRALDRFGNITPHNDSSYLLAVEHIGPGKCQIPQTAAFPPGNSGVIHIHNCQLDREGIYYFTATRQDTGEVFRSNPCIVKPHLSKRLFWGDMHGQSRETLGCGRLEDYLSFARDGALIDFTSWQGNDFEITDEAWDFIRKTIKEFNDERHFLVYLGYEWSGTSNAGGDHNVYFLYDSEHFYPSSNWLVPDKADVAYNAFPISQLHQRFQGRTDVMLTPHIGGRCSTLDFYHPDFIHNIEIHSQHGIFEWFAFDAMKRRIKVGFVATSDDHSGKPGMSYPSISEDEFSGSLAIRSGLTGVYAQELTRESIWQALKNRNCYASTLDRICLMTSLDGHIMGEEYCCDESPKQLQIHAVGSDVFDRVFVYDWDTCIYQEDVLSKNKQKIRVCFSGVSQTGRNKQADWNGHIVCDQPIIKNAVLCGYSLGTKAPRVASAGKVEFSARTNGEQKGIVVELDAHCHNASFTVHTTQGDCSFTYEQLEREGRIVKDMGGENLCLQIDFANHIPEDTAQRLKDSDIRREIPVPSSAGEHAFWVKVLQDDGNCAWSSPIFLSCT